MPGAPMDADSLIRVADKALYMAKNQGRDRAVFLEVDSKAEHPELIAGT